MKIIIFGATGKTGQKITSLAIEKGHTVSVFVRDPIRLTISQEKVNIITGDVFNEEAVTNALIDHDAVVVALGAGNDLKKTTVRTDGTTNVIKGMQHHSINRLFVISAMGVGDSWNTLSAMNKLFFATLLKSSRADHEAQESTVQSSSLEWTIIRPSGLVDTPRTGTYDVGENIPAKTSKIARADIADFILKELEQKQFIKKAVTITN